MEQSMIRINLADSEHQFPNAYRLRFDQNSQFEVIGEANLVENLLAQVCTRPPDAILLDCNLLGIHPQRLLNTLQEHCPATRLLASSVHLEHKKTTQELGVDTFLLKQLPPDQFFEALLAAVDESFDQRLHKEIQ
jgi:DNA-binding NarL/FixJ family response regulator